jgi:hypothetical protein
MNLFSSTFEERCRKEKKNKRVGDAEQRPSFVQEFKEAGFVNTKKDPTAQNSVGFYLELLLVLVECLCFSIFWHLCSCCLSTSKLNTSPSSSI